MYMWVVPTQHVKWSGNFICHYILLLFDNLRAVLVTVAGAPESASSGKQSGEDIKGCPYCNFSTVSESRLQNHVASAHAGAGTAPVNVPCPLCQEKFPDKSQLGQHLTTLHNVGREARNNLLAMVMVDSSSSPVPAATLSSPPTPTIKDTENNLDGKTEVSSKLDSRSEGKDISDGDVDAIRIGEDGRFNSVTI